MPQFILITNTVEGNLIIQIFNQVFANFKLVNCFYQHVLNDF